MREKYNVTFINESGEKESWICLANGKRNAVRVIRSTLRILGYKKLCKKLMNWNNRPIAKRP